MLKWSSGKVTGLDTSLDYAGSFSSIASLARKFRISTKIAFNGLEDISNIREQISRTLTMLNINKIDTLLIRESEGITVENLPKLYDFLEQYLINGQVQNIGFSLYSPQNIMKYGATSLFPLVFQIPLSIADRRFERFYEENLELCSKHKFVARSVFLQGVLLSEANSLPPKLQGFSHFLERLNDYARSQDLSVLEVCFGYIISQEWISSCVFGANSLNQLKETYGSFLSSSKDGVGFPGNLPEIGPNLTDPRLW
jgi:aryl-alcohol dehydrogenase-like predicted oxidoreductase